MTPAEEYAMAYVLNDRMTEAQLMGLLQGAGVISDNCVWLADVAEPDQRKAIKWMAENCQ